MEIPTYLVDEIRRGRAVLFLGAGASKGAEGEDGNPPPDAPKLSRLLAEHFLGGKFQDKQLHVVGELAVNEAGLGEVQDFIARLFRELKPGNFHRLMPLFRWYGIASTNYDLLLERIYEEVKDRLQELRPIVSNQDRIDEIVRLPTHVAYLKLHGCISRTHDKAIPLIITVEQYITHKTGRERLFRTLYEWGYNHPVIFIGHGLEDFDIRTILVELNMLGEYRPPYYLVTPSPSEEIRRFWASQRINVLGGTFEEFLLAIDSEISRDTRPLSALVSTEYPLQRRIIEKEDLSPSCYETLSTDLEYVHPGLPAEEGSPKAFYRGFDLGWYPVQQNLDVRRDLLEILLLEVMTLSEEDRPSNAELYVIKAEAGAGKSTLLRRLSWDAAADFDLLCLFLRNHGQLDYDRIAEIHRATRQRIYLFIDNAADHVQDLAKVTLRARREKLRLSIITAERINEWNMACEELEDYVTRNFRLPYLHRSEIEELVDLLQKYDSLGHLTGVSQAQQIEAFEKRAGRQLLVALHEVTAGKPFEEILVDEYDEIRPEDAQSLYLAVCVLNRLNVMVRAGLISRTQNIPFSQFREKLFAPLEHVVQAKGNPISTDDYYYTARHPEIAQIVFEQILTDPDDRFNMYARLLSNMNLAYSTDRTAFRGLIRGRTLIELFPEHKAVEEIFRIAEQLDANDAYVFHQKALYEMHRPNGNLGKASEYLKKANHMNSKDITIVHSMAELALMQSDQAKSDFERRKYREDCRKLAGRLIQTYPSVQYARHTLVKLHLEDFKEVLTGGERDEQKIDELIRKIESLLDQGLQEHPSDAHLLSSEADFRKLLEDDERVLSALKRAFEANRRDPFVASRLAKIYIEKGEVEKALAVLEDALDANPANKQLHFQYAMLLLETGESNLEKILYHLLRSFTKWDKNLKAQFLFARYAYESSDEDIRQKGHEVFHHLRENPVMPYEQRVELRDTIKENDKPAVFKGVLERKEDTYAFILVDGRGNRIFFHKDDVKKGTWDELTVGKRCSFNIGFTFFGPKVVEVDCT